MKPKKQICIYPKKMCCCLTAGKTLRSTWKYLYNLSTPSKIPWTEESGELQSTGSQNNNLYPISY